MSDAPAAIDSSADRRPTPIHDRLDRAARYWSARPATTALAAFAETPEGVQWLRQVLVAAHWCISEQGGAGVRVVCDFRELSGLSAFIGAAYGTQQAFQAELEQQIVTCASKQRAGLASTMPHRTLSIAEDETWKDGMRLVAIEPVSNFILVEQASDARSAAA